jgi:hypothetical protein
MKEAIKKEERHEVSTPKIDQIKWGRKKVRTDKRNWKNIVERFE